jgi:hypothetical protein
MVADPGNELPDTLRAGLFNLAGFTQRHSAAVLAGTANAEVLVEINTAVMRGLAPTPSAQKSGQPHLHPRPGLHSAAPQTATGGAR